MYAFMFLWIPHFFDPIEKQEIWGIIRHIFLFAGIINFLITSVSYPEISIFIWWLSWGFFWCLIKSCFKVAYQVAILNEDRYW